MENAFAKMTNHAYLRSKERIGLPKSAIERDANRALECGLKHSDTTGSLKKYMDSLYFTEKKSNNTRIWNGNVYLFHNNTLITVLPLPQKYRKIAIERAKKKTN